MATTARYGYNPNHAGNQLLKQCAAMRQQLTAALVKPSASDVPAFTAWIEAKAAIHAMDHRELRAAVAALAN